MYKVELISATISIMPTRPIATSIVKKLQDAGYIAYFAGGWVRDFLMQKPSDDIDIATNAPLGEIQKLFPKTIPVGIAFGIILVVEEGHPFEVATFRKDRAYIDGRRPVGFDPSTPEEDAQRRDFTINGLFYDPIKEELYDYVKGQQDIERKMIRAIGDPHERFTEDRLRLMRAVRYSTRFNFTIEEETQKAMIALSSSLFPSVAMERIWQEFVKMSKFAHFDEGLILLHQLGILPTIFSSLKTISLEEIKERVNKIERFPKQAPTIAELLELFPHSSLNELVGLCEHLKLSKKERQFVSFYHHAFSLLSLPHHWQNLELIEWAYFYAHADAQVCLEIFALHLPESEQPLFLQQHLSMQEKLAQPIMRIRTNNPIVKAIDLQERGIQPSKKMGELLKEAERISINEALEKKEEILQRLQLG